MLNTDSVNDSLGTLTLTFIYGEKLDYTALGCVGSRWKSYDSQPNLFAKSALHERLIWRDGDFLAQESNGSFAGDRLTPMIPSPE